VIPCYASRDRARAEEYCRQFNGAAAYGDYPEAISDPGIHAVVIAVPPRFHLDLTLRALKAGKHVLVEKPAFLTMQDYETVQAARDRAGRVVLVGENDHYKPLAVCLRRLLKEGVIGEMVFAHFMTLAKRLKDADDWRNDESMAGGDAFFEEGIHWLHLAGSLGPRIVDIRGYRPAASRTGPDRRAKSMMVAFRYDNDAVGSLYYSREVPSLLRGLRVSKLLGRDGIISFESNGVFILVRGRGVPRLVFPGFRDIRGYQAMYRDFTRSIREARTPEMSVERAMEDHQLMEQAYASAARPDGEVAVPAH
jgi:predicted dehydrogenase